MLSKTKKKESYGIILAKSLSVSILISLILLIVYAIILRYSNLPEKSISFIDTLIMGIAIVSGSIYVTKKVNNKGWLNGGIVGLLYVLILVIIFSIFKIDNFKFDAYVLFKVIIGMIIGVIGGMIGVNMN